MTTPNQPAVLPGETRVDAVRVINALRQRLSDEISKSVTLEVALAESQERERSLATEVARLQQAVLAADDS